MHRTDILPTEGNATDNLHTVHMHILTDIEKGSKRKAISIWQLNRIKVAYQRKKKSVKTSRFTI